MQGDELVRAAIRESASRFAACDDRLRAAGNDGAAGDAAIHDARVALRRLRSDLRSFRPYLDADWVADLRARLARAGAALGAARDADVLLARLAAAVETLPEQDRGRASEVLAPVRAERDAAYARVREMLAADEHAALRAAVAAAIDAPAGVDAAAPSAEVVAAVMRAAWKSLRKAVRRAGDAPADAALHRVRIKAKRARYAAEAFVPFAGGAARRFAKRAARLQEVLGEQHDAVCAAAHLRRTTWDARLAFVAGELAAGEARCAARCRARWRGALRRAKRARFWRRRRA